MYIQFNDIRDSRSMCMEHFIIKLTCLKLEEQKIWELHMVWGTRRTVRGNVIAILIIKI